MYYTTAIRNTGAKTRLSVLVKSRCQKKSSKVRVGVESAEANGECLQQGQRPLHVHVEAVFAHLILHKIMHTTSKKQDNRRGRNDGKRNVRIRKT